MYTLPNTYCRMRIGVGTVWLIMAAGVPLWAQTIEFGTDANGRPITWTRTAPADPAAATIDVDRQGRLHLKLEKPADRIELQADDPENFFGSYENQTPWIEFSWTDRKGDGPKPPNIDVYAVDNRPGKVENRVQGGSLFDWGCLAYLRYTGADGKAVEQKVTSGAPRSDGAEHSMRIAKERDGKIRLVFDGKPVEPASDYLLKGGLGTDHSAWRQILIRIRGGQPNEEFIFTSLKLGATPVPIVAQAAEPMPAAAPKQAEPAPAAAPPPPESLSDAWIAFGLIGLIAVLAVLVYVWRRGQ